MAYGGNNRKSWKAGLEDAWSDHFNAVGSRAPSLNDSKTESYFVLFSAAISFVAKSVRKTDNKRITLKRKGDRR